MPWDLRQFLFGHRSLYDHICDSHIKILSDNTTSVHCINNMGSCRSIDCDKITKSIWNWAIKRTLWLSSEHIPVRPNIKADEESRKTELRFEWKLNRKIFRFICV